MKFRYSDKPHRMFPDKIADLEKRGGFTATQKVDGWQCYIVIDKSGDVVESVGSDKAWSVGDGLYFLSRRDVNKGGPVKIPVSQEIVDTIKAFDWPDQTMISSEWMSRRSIGEIPECLFLLTPMFFDNKWIGRRPYSERLEFIHNLNIAMLGSPVRVPDFATDNYQSFFDAQKEIPYTEGMVLVHNVSKVVGDRDGCKKSRDMIKFKWRDGMDGRDIYTPPKRS